MESERLAEIERLLRGLPLCDVRDFSGSEALLRFETDPKLIDLILDHVVRKTAAPFEGVLWHTFSRSQKALQLRLYQRPLDDEQFSKLRLGLDVLGNLLDAVSRGEEITLSRPKAAQPPSNDFKEGSEAHAYLQRGKADFFYVEYLGAKLRITEGRLVDHPNSFKVREEAFSTANIASNTGQRLIGVKVGEGFVGKRRPKKLGGGI